MNNTIREEKDTEYQHKKFIRYKEGAILYSMSRSTFERRAKDAKAIYKMGKIALVNTEIFERYLESFRVCE